MIILNNVHNELCSYRSLKQFYEGVVERTNITFEKFPENNTELVLEYARLKKDGCGEGESASMAYAKHNNYILASSNISDVKDFCKSNNITLITTMDILYEALINNILSEEGCDDFIRVVVSKDSKLPYKTMQEYINRK